MPTESRTSGKARAILTISTLAWLGALTIAVLRWLSSSLTFFGDTLTPAEKVRVITFEESAAVIGLAGLAMLAVLALILRATKAASVFALLAVLTLVPAGATMMTANDRIDRLNNPQQRVTPQLPAGYCVDRSGGDSHCPGG